MTTLKILWQEKQDMRRVQVAAVNQALVERDGRAVADWNALRFRDLLDYVLLVFPEIDTTRDDVLLYYTDDDEELVRITTDVELAEAFRLMKELAVAMGRGESSAVCKMTLVTRPSTKVGGASTSAAAGSNATGMTEEVRTELVSQSLEADQQKRMMALFVDLSKVVEKWEPTWEHENLKRDVVSLLHEPGCQEALLEIMANQKVRFTFVSAAVYAKSLLTELMICHLCGQFASIFQKVSEEFQKVCRVFISKCSIGSIYISAYH